MDVELISTEKIKPALATPDHLRIYNISFLDQFIPCIYTPVVLYFSDGGGDEESIRLLKDSLSTTLATFYPFAGVNRDPLSADCNDEGVPFSVAKVNGKIRDFLQNPNYQLMSKFYPSKYNQEVSVSPGDNMMMIQLNCFECGGIAMCMLFPHFVADLSSDCTFIRSWAANALGSGQVTATMDRTAQSSFPQKASLPMELIPSNAISTFLSMGKFVTRRYVFDASALSILKAESRSPAVPTPTRVGAVTAAIWKCFMAAVAEKSAAKPFVLAQAVNLRRRAVPPFPEKSFGNFVWIACTLCTNHEEKGLKELVAEMKEGVAKIDDEFMKRMEGDGEDHNLYEFLKELGKEMPQEAQWLISTSWVNNGLCHVDFGWGKPVWMSRGIPQYETDSETKSPNNNFVVLTDRKDGDGIEACVNLDTKYVEGFERNELIHKYARVNPSVI